MAILNATDQAIADSKRAVLREQLERIESELSLGPYFSGAEFSMVDAVQTPVFRYFSIIDASVSEAIFEGLQRGKLHFRKGKVYKPLYQ